MDKLLQKVCCHNLCSEYPNTCLCIDCSGCSRKTKVSEFPTEQISNEVNPQNVRFEQVYTTFVGFQGNSVERPKLHQNCLGQEQKMRGQVRHQESIKDIFSDQVVQIQPKKIVMFHKQNEQSPERKTFVFEDELTGTSTIVYHFINTQKSHIDIRPILDQHCPLSTRQISMFDTWESKFLPLNHFNPNQPTVIPNRFLEYGFIMFRYRPLKTQNSQNNSGPCQESNSSISISKKDRSRQRTIGEVIQLVRKWRSLHTAKSTKKLNLQEAARVVGVSKKSLDDYYYQLRLGEQNDFEFSSNLNEKIGVLRNFVKQKRPQKTQKHRNIKHPKKLKIIQMSDMQPEQRLEKLPSESRKKQKEESLFVQSPFLRSQESQQENISNISGPLVLERDEDLAAIENNYYRNFGNFLDQDVDPFFYEGDFQKKDSFNLSFGSDSQLQF